MSSWGIRPRVLVLALLPSVMILLALVTYFTYEQIAEVDASLALRGRLVARQLAPGAEFALFAGDRVALQRAVDAAAREADVRTVAIADAQGHELARSGSSDDVDPSGSVTFTEPVAQTRIAAADFPEQGQAGPGDAEVVGRITIAMSRAGARAQQRQLMLVGLALGLAGLLVAIALALVIGNGIIRPTRELARAMIELGQNRRVQPLPSEGGGEFRTLSDGFNNMAARLRAATRELETRIAEATRAAVEQKNAAEQATQAKSRFIAAATHELRQPLHAIGLFTAALERRAGQTELRPVVTDLAKSVAMMDRMFDSLLDISQLDAGTLHAESRAFPLSRLFTQLAAEFSDTAIQKQLRLRVVPTAAIVCSDELLLRRVLTNLVSNAVRYTSAGTVLLCCRYRTDAVAIEVRDSGIGIPEERQEAIFQEFYQIGYPERQRSMGLGLGLAIVFQLAKLLRTEVRVRSAPGRGSVFSLRLPRGEGIDVPTASTGDDGPPVTDPFAGLPLLVVDDDPLVLSGNRALLESMGCEVTTVSDGAAATAALAALRSRPLVVLCDLWLAKGEDGIDLLRRLAALTTAPVCCILISGDTRPETIARAGEAGFTMLRKPVSPAELRAAVVQFARQVQPIPDAD